MPVRARTADVFPLVRQALLQEVSSAAGNALLSRREQQGLSSALLTSTAEDLRTHGGPGSRVPVAALADLAAQHVVDAFAQVNQASGPGRAAVSLAEIQALARRDAELGGRVARAYELVTGRRVDLGPPPASANRSLPERIALAAARAFGIPTAPDTPTAPGWPRVLATGSEHGKDTADLLVPDATGNGGVGRAVLDLQGSNDVIVDFRWITRPQGPARGFDAGGRAMLEGRLAALGLIAPRVLGGGLTDGGTKTWRLAVESTDGAGARRVQHYQLRGRNLGNAQLVPPTLFMRDLLEVAMAVAHERSMQAAANIGPLGEAEVQLRSATAAALTDPADSPFGFDPQRELQIEVSPLLGDMATFVTFEISTLALLRVEMV